VNPVSRKKQRPDTDNAHLAKRRLRKGSHATFFGELNTGETYTAEEIEYLKAVDAWKKLHRVRFPSNIDLLNIAKSLGYRRVMPKE
jgi:hypothetical protein